MGRAQFSQPRAHPRLHWVRHATRGSSINGLPLRFVFALSVDFVKNTVILVGPGIGQRAGRPTWPVGLPARRRSRQLLFLLKHGHLNVDFLPIDHSEVFLGPQAWSVDLIN
jgi:hypothetical protein